MGSSKSCDPKRFSRCCNKVERKYIQEQHPNQFQCYNQNMGSVNGMALSLVNYRNGWYSKESRFSSSHVGIRNIRLDIFYQVQSEHRRTQNPFKHLRWSVFV